MKVEPTAGQVKQPLFDDEHRRRLLEITGVVPWEVDAETWQVTYVGATARDLLGYPLDAWYETDFWATHIHPEDRDSAVNFCEVHSKTHTDFELEYRMITADGQVVWIRDVINVAAERGRPRVLVGLMIDITARKRIEEKLRKAHGQLEARVEERTAELRASEGRLKEAQRIAKIGSWERNIATNEVWWSDETYRIFAIDPETSTALYDTFIQRIHPDDRQRVISEVANAQQRGGPYEIHCRLQLPAGTVKNVHGRAVLDADADGRPIRWVGTTQDITEQVQLERQVIAAGENERNRIGRELHDGLGQELTGISLALRTVHEKLARKKSPEAQTVEALTQMVQNTINETRRVSQLLSPGFSNNLAFSEMLAALAREINQHSSVRFSVRCSHEEIHDGEALAQFYRITQEAVNNAMKHSGAQNIDLYYGRDGDRILLEILDDGVGIPPVADRIEGMGLRSMRHRARMMNGTLVIAARAERGTRVLCSCPVGGRPVRVGDE